MIPVASSAGRRRGAAAVLGALVLLGIAVTAAAAPLWTYALSLAAFGVPHVVAELRYVDGRFGRRLGRSLGLVVAGGLATIVALRAGGIDGGLPATTALRGELALAAILAFAVLLRRRGSLAATGAPLLVGAALGAGAWLDPGGTAVVVALLHNATPVGFLAERFVGPTRRRVLAACLLAFVAVPLVVASGIPGRALGAIGGSVGAAGWATTGPLSGHLGVFVPAGWRDGAQAIDLFAAAAYLQVLHHLTVLLVLPRLLGRRGAEDRPIFPWPRAPWLVSGLAVAGVFAFVLFARDFRGSRAAYGLLAAVHAWLEVPVLLLVLTPSTALASREEGLAAGT